MRNLIILTALLSFLNSVHVPVCTAGSHLKPQAPIKVTILPSERGESTAQRQDEHAIDLKVAVTAEIDQPGIAITIKASKGAEIVSGEVNWTGSLKKEETKIMIITARPSKTGKGKITARAEPPAGDAGLFRAEAHYEFGKNTETKQRPASRATKDRKNRDLIEYEVK